MTGIRENIYIYIYYQYWDDNGPISEALFHQSESPLSTGLTAVFCQTRGRRLFLVQTLRNFELFRFQ